MDTKYVPNKSIKCHQPSCGEYGKVPIYFRDSESRSFKVAFYVCTFCMNFSGFINWKTLRSMPYFNDMQGLINVRLVKNNKENENDVNTVKEKVFAIRKQFSGKCFKCKTEEISKVYLRYDRKKPRYIGYICKKCRTVYLLNTNILRLKTRDPTGYYNEDGSLPIFHKIPFDEYMGNFATQIGEDEEEPKFKDLYLRVGVEDAKKIEKFLKEKRIEIIS